MLDYVVLSNGLGEGGAFAKPRPTRFLKPRRSGPISRPTLTAENLGDALRLAATDPHLRQRANALGEKIRAEDAVGRAVEVIEEYLRGKR
jgi:hypothetical protein